MARRRQTPPRDPRRVAQTRVNARVPGAFQPTPQQGFQGGVGLNRQGPAQLPGVQTAGDVPVNDPNTKRQGPCPPGMRPAKDPNTGAATCVPSTRGQGGPRGPRGPGGSNPNTGNQGY